MKPLLRIMMVGLGVAGVSLVSPARAQDPDDGELVRHGIELRRARRDAEALEAFRAAYALKATPRTRAQLGFAEEATADWQNAEIDLLGAAADDRDPWIIRNRAAIHAAIDEVRAHLASLEVSSNVEGAELIVNGQSRGHLPLETAIRVPAGDVTIEVRAPGYVSVEEAIALPARGVLRQVIRLNVAPQGASSVVGAEAQPAPAVAAGAHAPEIVEPSKPAANSAPPVPRAAIAAMPSLGWGLVAGAGVFLGAGLTAHVVSANAAATYNDDSRCFYGGLSRDERCATYRDRAETTQFVAMASYVASAASLIAAGVLFAVSIKTPRREGRAQLVCAPSVLSPGASCVGTF